ncbi:MAG: bacteriohopanetetrol glucosamine biosynthesis glycosyltransferase HpnI [Acidobacteriia bacterium]|nr:bacteriohopanetetrol glucosamine biosynthesis glycosyltransferase HpnI [Terriglobia bacterium]
MIGLAVPALAAAAYYLLAIVAAILWRRSASGPLALPPVSILKPMYGTEEGLYEAIRSHAAQDYPEFEILFGFGDADDPARAEVERLQQEFPGRSLRAIVARPDAPNAKVAVLAELARQARYGLLVVNDDDIVAGPGYLRSVVAPFANPQTGLVTCLYRAPARSFPSLIEGLGIATEFAPSVMVARLLGVADFALGSTMAVRAETLREIGGFEAIADYLADDYQLGRRVAARGYRVEFASAVVETGGGGRASWGGMWRHQLRWSRTIRVSQPPGYYGSVVTHATVWALVAFLAGQWWAGTAALALRLVAAALAGGVILEDRQVWRWFWLIPFRDLFGFAVWMGGCFGSTVDWRGRTLRLRRDGRITEES